MKTIQEAKQYLRQTFEKGSTCPCCGQGVKLYHRPIYFNQAFSLINLYKLGPGYFHISAFSTGRTGGGDFAKLRFWGLIAEQPNTDDGKRTSGMWEITEKGINWVLGETTVQKYVDIYNQKPISFSSDQISIREALGNDFNYDELMGF